MKNIILLFLLISVFRFVGYSQQVDFSCDDNLCENREVQFTNESFGNVTSWSWDFGDGSTSDQENPKHTYTVSGKYTVTLQITISSSNFSETKDIVIGQKPIAKFVVDTVLYSSYSRVFTDASTYFQKAQRFEWSFGDGDTLDRKNEVYHKYKKAGKYNVQLVVTDSSNCKDSVTNQVEVFDMFSVPNVFTPNNDGQNDLFVVYSNGETLFSIEIYSRWGNLLFRREGHQQIVWDGRITSGTLVKPGTYFYVLKVESGDQEYEPLNGFLTILY